MKSLSRRDFLQAAGTGLVALGGLAAGLRLRDLARSSPTATRWLSGPLRQLQRGAGRYQAIDWPAGIAALRRALTAYRPDEIVFLLGDFPDHLFDFVQRLATVLGGAGVLRYSLAAELEGRVTLQDAAQKLFGMPQVPHFDLWNADLVFSFSAGGESWLPLAHGASSWSLLPRPARRCYWVQFDELPSPTARQADEWLRPRPGSQALLAQALARRVGELRGAAAPGDGATGLAQAAAQSGLRAAELERLARLFAGVQNPLAVPGAALLGDRNGLAAAEAVLSLNSPVGANGIRPTPQTGSLYFHPPLPLCSNPAARPVTLAEMTVLIERMRRGQVKALLVHGADPLDELPAGLGFLEALRAVEQVFSFSPALDATSAWADYLLPDYPPGTDWGYQRAGPVCDRPALIALQPQAAPPGDSRSLIETLLAAFQGTDPANTAALPFASPLDYLQYSLYTLNPWGGAYQAGSQAEFWAAWRQHGGWQTTARPRMPALALTGMGATRIQDSLPQDQAYPLAVQFFTQPPVDRAGTPWLALSPAAAAALRLRPGQAIEVTSPFSAIHAIARPDASIAPAAAAMPFCWGRALLGAPVNASGSLAWRQINVRCQAA